MIIVIIIIIIIIITSPPSPARGAKYCHQHSMSVCLSVCPIAHLEKDMSKLQEMFYVHDICGCGSVLWRQCNMSCSSGFVDDVMFLHNGPHGPWLRGRILGDSQGGSTGAKLCCLRSPCYYYHPAGIPMRGGQSADAGVPWCTVSRSRARVQATSVEAFLRPLNGIANTEFASTSCASTDLPLQQDTVCSAFTANDSHCIPFPRNAVVTSRRTTLWFIVDHNTHSPRSHYDVILMMTAFATELATPSVTDERTLRTYTLARLIYKEDITYDDVI